MEPLFKALADPSRRLLLERLLVVDGQTLTQLCGGHAMTRQAVTKHLLVLEGAGVIASSWKGREKLHWLKPAPLQRVRDWVNQFDRHGLENANRAPALAQQELAPEREALVPAAVEPESRSFSICGVD